MGLLSNEKHRSRLVALLVKHDQKLRVLVYSIGLVWFLALAYQPLNAGTYFSENALLPGLVETELPSVLHSADQYKEQIQAELKKDTRATPQNWIYERFRDIGIEAYMQNFSVLPFTSASNRVAPGQNVYAILRARRAASTEALVLSVPLRPHASKGKVSTGGGIALALALAEEFKRKPYWSKDIIFLFSDFDEVGAMAWLDAYHQTDSQYILTKDLEGRSGPIQAAINLELPIDNVHYYNLRIEGLNGQMPNLDLVNLVARLCRRERARIAIHHSMEEKRSIYSDPDGASFYDYKQSLKTMLRMMWFQASGAPSGNHGMFQKFHIEAVTIQGIVKKKGIHDITTTAKIIEGIFRSLNNLLERFHQSFFFYLLPSTNRYVSIGMYMPPFGLMALAGLIKGIALWVTPNDEDEEKEKSKTEGDEDSKEGDNVDVKGDIAEVLKEDKPEISEKRAPESPISTFPEKDKIDNQAEDQEKKEDSEDTPQIDSLSFDDDMDAIANKGIMTVIPVILVSLLLGWMAHQGPELLTRIMPKFRIHTDDMVIYSILAIFTAALMYPRLMTKKSNTPNTFILDWRLLKSIALIAQTLALASVSLLNISQAFFLTAVMVPVTTMVRPAQGRISRWIQLAALVLVSPLALMLVVGMLSAMPQKSTLDLLIQGYTNCKELIFLGVTDAYLFNAWTETIITAVIFPIWLLFWAIPFVEP